MNESCFFPESYVYILEAVSACFELASLYFPVRMKIQPCGSVDRVREQCRLFQQTHITACRARISILVDLGKVSNLPYIMVIQTSTVLRQGCHWISNYKARGTGPLKDPMSNQSSLGRYGKTATRAFTSQGFLHGVCNAFGSGQASSPWLNLIRCVMC